MSSFRLSPSRSAKAGEDSPSPLAGPPCVTVRGKPSSGDGESSPAFADLDGERMRRGIRAAVAVRGCGLGLGPVEVGAGWEALLERVHVDGREGTGMVLRVRCAVAPAAAPDFREVAGRRGTDSGVVRVLAGGH